MGVSSRLFLVTHDRGDFGHLDFNRHGQVLARCLLWIGEIGSPAQLVPLWSNASFAKAPHAGEQVPRQSSRMNLDVGKFGEYPVMT